MSNFDNLIQDWMKKIEDELGLTKRIDALLDIEDIYLNDWDFLGDDYEIAELHLSALEQGVLR